MARRKIRDIVTTPNQLYDRILVIGLPPEQVEVLRPDLEPCGVCFMTGPELRFRSQVAPGTGCVVVFSPGLVEKDQLRVKRVIDTRFIPWWTSRMLDSIELFIRARLKSYDGVVRVASDKWPVFIGAGAGDIGVDSREYKAAVG